MQCLMRGMRLPQCLTKWTGPNCTEKQGCTKSLSSTHVRILLFSKRGEPSARILKKNHARKVVRLASPYQPNTHEGAGSQQQYPRQQLAVEPSWSSTLAWAIATTGRLMQNAVSFVRSCWDVLPQFTVLSPQQAFQRMILILAASLLMVVILTTIDSGLLYFYVRAVRRTV